MKPGRDFTAHKIVDGKNGQRKIALADYIFRLKYNFKDIF
nr:MAG TPA: hypothetical protein [Caudoviricetes sp.]